MSSFTGNLVINISLRKVIKVNDGRGTGVFSLSIPDIYGSYLGDVRRPVCSSIYYLSVPVVPFDFIKMADLDIQHTTPVFDIRSSHPNVVY